MAEPAFNPLKDALAKKKDGKKGGITLGIGSDKNQMQALGDAVKARLEMDKDFETQDENVPPPPAVALEGPPLPGLCGGFVGIFERQPKREMEGGAPAYRSVRNPVLWLARDGEGVWRGQVEGKLGEMASLLKLADKGCLHPSSTTDEPWQYIDPETRDWEKAWRHKCREATAEEVADTRASLPEVPEYLSLEGPALPGEMASGFVGLYMRAKEMKERVEVGREVLGSPCWRQLQNPSLYIVRANDGGWVCQGEDAISTAAGFLRLRDSTCHLPSDLTAISWLVHTGGSKASWVEVKGLKCRLADATEVDAVKSAFRRPPAFLRFGSSDGDGDANGHDHEHRHHPQQHVVHGQVCCGHEEAEPQVDDYSGIYMIQDGHVNKSAAWRRIKGPKGEDLTQRDDESLWIVRGRNGCWVGQSETQLNQQKGGLQLPTTSCKDPSLAERPWQRWMDKAWKDVPRLKCIGYETEEEALATTFELTIGDGGGCCEDETCGHGEAHEHGHAK